jgi:hypothetical protein
VAGDSLRLEVVLRLREDEREVIGDLERVSSIRQSAEELAQSWLARLEGSPS